MNALQPRHDHSGMDMDMDGTSSMSGMKMYFHAGIPSTDYLLFQSWVPSSIGPVIGACMGLFVIAIAERFLAALQRGATIHWRRDALRRLANASSTEYKPPRGDVIPAYNPSTSTEKPSPANTDSPQDEIMPVLSSNPSSTSSTTQRRLPSNTATPTDRQQAPPPSYLPRTVVRAMTDRARPDRYSIPFIWRNELARGGLMFVTRALSYVLMLVVMTFNVWFIVAVCLGAGVGEAMFGRHGYMH